MTEPRECSVLTPQPTADATARAGGAAQPSSSQPHRAAAPAAPAAGEGAEAGGARHSSKPPRGGAGGGDVRSRADVMLDTMLAEFVLKAKREQRIRQLYPPPLDIGW